MSNRQSMRVDRPASRTNRDAREGRRTGERRPLKPLAGFLTLFVALALALIASVFATIIAVAGAWMGLGGASAQFARSMSIISLVLTAGLIPFLLGILLYRWGWVLGLSYSMLYLFVALPWYMWGEFSHNYMWTPKGFFPKTPPWIVIPMVAGGAIAFSLLGSLLPLKKLRLRVYLERPLAALAPVIGVSLLLSLLAPVLMHPLLERVSIFECPEYGFMLEVPSGWYEIPNNYGGKKYVVSDDDAVREQAIAEIQVDSTAGAPNGGGNVRIFVYKTMPFTGEPLSSFGSREEVYVNLRSILEGERQEHERIVLQRFKDSPTLTKFNWDGETTLGGVQAYRLYYSEDQIDPMYDKIDIIYEPTPTNIYLYDIVVYRKPYLYWLQMRINTGRSTASTAYNEIKDSFKFIEPDR